MDSHTRSIRRFFAFAAMALVACVVVLLISYDNEREAQACAGVQNQSLCSLAYDAHGVDGVAQARANGVVR